MLPVNNRDINILSNLAWQDFLKRYIVEFYLQLDLAELQTILAKDRETFPSNPSVWLKDLASVLVLHLDKVQEADPVFADQPAGSCLMVDFLNNTVETH